MAVVIMTIGHVPTRPWAACARLVAVVSCFYHQNPHHYPHDTIGKVGQILVKPIQTILIVVVTVALSKTSLIGIR